MDEIDLAVQLGQLQKREGERVISVSPEMYGPQCPLLRQPVRRYQPAGEEDPWQKGWGRATHLQGNSVPESELQLMVMLCLVLLVSSADLARKRSPRE